MSELSIGEVLRPPDDEIRVEFAKNLCTDSLRIDLGDKNGQKARYAGDEIDQDLNVGFQEICYTVNVGLIKREQKSLLKNVTGHFRAGELTAIMGPSGAGKSTLMNILAGYTTGATGKLLINDEIRNERKFLKQSCYIMQDDQLQPLLTVHEAMMIAAQLKLSSKYSTEQKREKVKEILNSMSLWEHKTSRTQRLSGGQRKRLSIALEMLKNPQVMFFDEPTSGLDSLTSKQCVTLLKELAQKGRTIICTIHQPSAMIFEMFNHLYVLAQGYCVYQGSVQQLLPYLGELNLICPTYHNPADFVLEVASGDLGDYLDKLLVKSANGRNMEWRENDSVQENDNFGAGLKEKMVQNGQLHPIGSNHLKRNYEKVPKIIDCCDSDYPTSCLNQLIVLIKRTFLILSRDPTLTYSRIATHLAIALFIGCLYYGIGVEASNMLNNFNFLFFSVMFLMMTAFNCITTTFPSELPIITREHFNKWYSLKSYYLAITFADIPVQILATLLYGFITYFLTKQPLDEPYRICFFLLMCIMISMVAQSFGLFIGASMDVKNGVIFGPFCFLPFTIFSGFFVQLHAAHPLMRWVFHISFLKYGLEGLVLSVLGYGRGKMPCEADYCHYVYPKLFLSNMDMDSGGYWTAISFMIGLTALIRVAAYFALKIQINRRRS